MRTFTQALMEMKRKATLSGRPVSKQEVSGIAAGAAATSAERLSRAQQLAEIKRSNLAREKLSEESMRAQMSAAEEARKAERKQSRMSGAMAGAAAGTYVMPGIGTAVGAVAGYIFGGSGGCIIISACTDSNSYEVKIARQFRDKYLGSITLLGYYRFSTYIVPFIKKSNMFKRIMKKALVDNLIKYGEWILKKKKKPSQMTILITECFLGLCKMIGNRMFIKMEEA